MHDADLEWELAAERMVAHLFGAARLHRIEMQVAVENTASRAIPERLGFHLEGVRRESHWISTRFLDHSVYGLLAHEWVAEARTGRGPLPPVIGVVVP